MTRRLSTCGLTTVFLALIATTAGCHGGAQSPTGPAVLAIRSIFPTTGPLAGATQVGIYGSGFEAGAIVTFNGVAASFSMLSSAYLTVTTPAHAAGPVDVVVTNPNGATATLAGAYTYVVPPPSEPIITAIEPNRVATTGGAFVEIQGSNFRPGATVTIDGTPITAFPTGSFIFINTMPAHPAGVVDVVVTNTDGQSVRVAGGLTYATPDAFDLNGDWDGYPPDSEDPTFRFTIQNNVVTSVTCGTAAPLVLSPPPAVANGAFAFAGADGTSMSGHVLSATQMVGAINAPVCGAIAWFGGRHQ